MLIGTVASTDSTGNLVVKASKLLKIGTKVIDSEEKPAGKVVDVIGNVNAPWLVVRPSQPNLSAIYWGKTKKTAPKIMGENEKNDA